MTRLVHQKDTCYNKIGLCAQHKDTIIGSTINTKKKAYMIGWPLKDPRGLNAQLYTQCLQASSTPNIMFLALLGFERHIVHYLMSTKHQKYTHM